MVGESSSSGQIPPEFGFWAELKTLKPLLDYKNPKDGEFPAFVSKILRDDQLCFHHKTVSPYNLWFFFF